MPGIWLSDDEVRNSAGAIWLQQQQQRVQAGQDWAGQQMARIQQQAAQQVAQLAPSPVAPPPVAAPAPIPAPVPAPAPTPAPAPVVPIGGTPTAAPMPPVPGDLTATPNIAPPAPTPQAPTVPTPAPTPSIAEVGQSWAQQQINNLLNPSASSPSSTPTTPLPAMTPSPPSPVSALPDQNQAQGGLTPPAPTPSPPVTQAPTPATSAAPDRTMSLQDYARAAAQRAGIDPNVFTAQIQQESGFNPTAKSPAGALGIAQFMPGTAAGVNLDPTDPYASLDAAAKMDAQNLGKYQGDWNKTLAAYNAGGGNVDKYGGVPPFEETQRYVKTIMGNAQQAAQNAGTAISSGIDTAKQGAQDLVQKGVQAVNTTVQAGQAALARAQPVEAQRQFEQEAGLSAGDAYTACGPVAAAAFAATYGRNPSPSEAIALARQVGWNPQQGMAGAQSEVKLLNAMGIDAHMTNGVDWANVGRDASGGNPVIIDTPGHYYYVDGYNQDTGQLHVGASGLALKGGSEWMTPDQINQMPQSHGSARAAIFADHPLAQSDGLAQSTAAPSKPAAQQQTVMGGMQDAAGNALANAPLPFIGSSANQIGDLFNQNQQQLQQGRDLVGSILSPDPNAPTPLRAKADSILQSVQDVGGQATQASQNLLQQGQNVLQGAQQAPQTVSDMLNQNALTASGIPNIGGKALEGAQDVLGQVGRGYETAPERYPALFAANPPLDLTKPLGPQLGVDPYGQIVQQGIPSMISGAQRGDVGGVLGGGVQTLLGAASALPGGAGPEAAAGRSLLQDALTSSAARDLLFSRLDTGPSAAAATPALEAAQLGVSAIPWSAATRGLLEQGPAAQEAATPAVQRAIDQAAQARAAGLMNPQLAVGTFDEFGRRIPQGLIENPMTSAELGRPSYDQYGVFQREPALYSDRGVAMDPATGQEIVPPSEGPLDWRTQMPSSSVLEGLQQMARERGLDPTTPILSQRLQALTDQVNASAGTPLRQPGMASAEFARLLGGGALGGGAAYETTDPNDPNRWLKVAAGAGAGALAGGPGLDLALRVPGTVARASGTAPGPISLGNWLEGAYKGGVIGGLNTMADVASNATLSPILSAGAGYVRDLASLSPGRMAGRTLGAMSGIADWGDNFLAGLSDALSRPTSLSARSGAGAPRIMANLIEGAGALHGAFQNATSELMQAMEHGAAAGDAAGNNIFSPAWHGSFTTELGRLPADVVARAQALGDRTAGRGDLGTLASAFGNFVNRAGPIGDALFPVYRMGMALGSRMVESSPMGLAGTGFDVARSFVGQGPYAAGLRSTPTGTAVGPLTERLTNNIIGTATSMWLANKALAGQITGGGPTDPGQRQAWLANGNQPDSVLGPDGVFHSWDKLPPQLRGPMMTAGAYADAYQTYTKALATKQTAGPQAYGIEEPLTAAAWQLVSEVGRQMASATPMRTLADLYDAVGSSSSAAGAGMSAAGDVASKVIGGAVPASGLVRSVAQMTDPLQRQTLVPRTLQELPQSVLENVEQNIPGAREGLPARVDALGRATPNPLQGLGELSPFRAAAGVPSPILDAYQRAGVGLSAPPSTIPYGPAAELRLKPEEQRAYEQYRGQILERSAANLVATPRFQQMPAYAQRAALQQINTVAASAAGQMVLRDIIRTPGAAQARMQPTGVLAPVVGYGPDVMGNEQLLLDQLRRNTQHQALMQSLLGG